MTAQDDERRPQEGVADPGSVSQLRSAGNDERHPLQEISSAMVQIYKDQFGRGPTKVRTHYAGPDTVICLLEHSFTPAERNLQAMGEHQRLRDVRLFFQYAEESRFIVPVERATGRKVRAFISGVDTSADVSAEMFVLEPEGAPPGDDPAT
ncbi:MAG: Na-translocating system protein MpsC family protein [Solirubrobacteraceae bacterium]